MAEIRIEPATASDFGALCQLLEAAKLPTEDLDAGRLDGFLIAWVNAVAIGSVGIERYGDVGLLRSLVVAGAARARGVGGRLTAAAEALATQFGIRTLYLLTTTAAAYFESRSYRITARGDAPPAIASTPQFSGLCPSTSTFMSKVL